VLLPGAAAINTCPAIFSKFDEK